MSAQTAKAKFYTEEISAETFARTINGDDEKSFHAIISRILAVTCSPIEKEYALNIIFHLLNIYFFNRKNKMDTANKLVEYIESIIKEQKNSEFFMMPQIIGVFGSIYQTLDKNPDAVIRIKYAPGKIMLDN
ncbi:MAG: hypothetical protein D6732_17605 [Methanobacteriota archaeon]|nr:MAG: hypothetical protein D6732_17605 [Euryarchaeota archaeon]